MPQGEDNREQGFQGHSCKILLAVLWFQISVQVRRVALSTRQSAEWQKAGGIRGHLQNIYQLFVPEGTMLPTHVMGQKSMVCDEGSRRQRACVKRSCTSYSELAF